MFVPRRAWSAVVPVTLTLFGAACGSGGGAKAPSAARIVDIDMRDVAFSPASVDVPPGELVRFVFHNRGRVQHEAFIGDEKAQAGHEGAMGSMDDMHHGGGNEAVTVQPGKTASLQRSFRRNDSLVIGCHEPGHYAAGMKVAVHVE